MELELHQLDMRYERLRAQRPAAERRVLTSLAELGQQAPVVVVTGREPDHFVLVDGYKRVRSLRRLRHDTVRATRWDLDEAEALLLDRLMRTAEAETALEQGWLRDEFDVLAAVARRVRRKLGHGAWAGLLPPEREDARRSFADAEREMERLKETSRKEMTDAGSGDTGGDLTACGTGS